MIIDKQIINYVCYPDNVFQYFFAAVMIRNFSADYIFPVSSAPIKDGVVSVDENGEIVGVFEKGSAAIQGETPQRFPGIIVPGFVNSHCHLELSHLHQKIAPQNGLVAFITEVMASKKEPAAVDTVKAAMKKADDDMYRNGIVAVGDISNTDISAGTKRESRIYYHTYVELLGFSPAAAPAAFDYGMKVLSQFDGLSASVVPHSPYSVSKNLFKLIKKQCETTSNLLCMHSQETDDENTFFRYKRGRFVDFYDHLKQDISFFRPQARNSIQSVIPLMEKETPVLLVHNTFTSLKDIYFIKRFGRNVTWCLCPNANLHIENRLPKIDMLQSFDYNITIGTDSLASNNQLCMLSELKAIQDHFPHIPLQKMVGWATLNGARFLGIDNQFGSIERGKKPGLNLISNVEGPEKLTAGSAVARLV